MLEVTAKDTDEAGYRCSSGVPGPSVVDDALLLLVLRDGARRILQQVIEAEAESFLGAHGRLENAYGRRRFVRNRHAPEREVQTGIGPISVRRPKVRNRGKGAGGERIRFTSKVLPPLWQSKNVEDQLNLCTTRGLSDSPDHQLWQKITSYNSLKTNERRLDPSTLPSASFGRR